MNIRSICLIAFAALLLGSGCISVRTYEEKLKWCRELEKKSVLLEDEVIELRGKTKALMAGLDLAEREQAILQDTIERQEEYITNLRKTYDDLIKELKDEISRGDIAVSQVGDSLRIVMEEKILFRSGEAILRDKGIKIINRIADVIKDVKGHDISVEGHTDNVRISPRLQKFYPTNWELSGARSASVIRALIDRGVNPHDLILTAFSKYRPVAPNDTDNGREQNRRVEMMLTPKKDQLQ